MKKGNLFPVVLAVIVGLILILGDSTGPAQGADMKFNFIRREEEL